MGESNDLINASHTGLRNAVGVSCVASASKSAADEERFHIGALGEFMALLVNHVIVYGFIDQEMSANGGKVLHEVSEAMFGAFHA